MQSLSALQKVMFMPYIKWQSNDQSMLDIIGVPFVMGVGGLANWRVGGKLQHCLMGFTKLQLLSEMGDTELQHISERGLLNYSTSLKGGHWITTPLKGGPLNYNTSLKRGPLNYNTSLKGGPLNSNTSERRATELQHLSEKGATELQHLSERGPLNYNTSLKGGHWITTPLKGWPLNYNTSLKRGPLNYNTSLKGGHWITTPLWKGAAELQHLSERGATELLQLEVTSLFSLWRNRIWGTTLIIYRCRSIYLSFLVLCTFPGYFICQNVSSLHIFYTNYDITWKSYHCMFVYLLFFYFTARPYQFQIFVYTFYHN